MAEEASLNRDTVLKLLGYSQYIGMFMTEEERHPWRITANQEFRMPLLRIWDNFSGSQPKDNRMLARGSRQPLNTKEARIASIKTHIDHKEWEDTPFISFTTSASRLQEIADSRLRGGKRGAYQTLTAIDPRIRLRAGLPFLEIAPEMNHYGIEDPYSKSSRYYIDEFVCLWEVTGAEIIGHWDWNNLRTNDRWYEDIIIPAFRRFGPVQRASVTEEPSDLSKMLSRLVLANNSADPNDDFYDACSSSNEGQPYPFQDDKSDTDDEVEEAHISDDVIKLAERL